MTTFDLIRLTQYTKPIPGYSPTALDFRPMRVDPAKPQEPVMQPHPSETFEQYAARMEAERIAATHARDLQHAAGEAARRAHRPGAAKRRAARRSVKASRRANR